MPANATDHGRTPFKEKRRRGETAGAVDKRSLRKIGLVDKGTRSVSNRVRIKQP
jgi:hypothetical protein